MSDGNMGVGKSNVINQPRSNDMSKKPTVEEWVSHAQEFAKFYQPTVQAKINGWSALNTGDGIAVKHLGGSTLEVCLSVDDDGELVIEVHQEGVDEPVLVANVRESTEDDEARMEDEAQFASYVNPPVRSKT